MDKIKISTLQGQVNYQDWKFQVENMLKYYGLTKVVCGEWKDVTPPSPSASADDRAKYQEEHEKWTKSDCHATALLTSSMEKEVRDQFRICKTAKDVWDHLKLLYEQKSNQRLDLLYCELFNYKKNISDSVIVHVTKLRSLWQDIKEELALLDPTAKMPDSMLVSRVLHTLTHEEFIRFNNTWDAMPAKEQTIEKLTELLRLLEVRIEQSSADSENSVALKSDAGKKRTSGKFELHQDRSNYDNSYRRGCFVCGSFDHLVKDCTDPRKRSKDDYVRKDSKTSNRKAFGYIGLSAETDNQNVKQDAPALLSEKVDGEYKNVWIADSGCNKHITRSKEYYVTYNSFVVPKYVRIGNDSEVPAYGKGTIYIEMTVDQKKILGYLNDVWYVPDFVADIFSVGTCLDKGYEQISDKFGTKFIKNGRVMAEGIRLCDGLFGMKMQNIPPCEVAECLVATDSLQLWHERFGHQGKSHIKTFLKGLGYDVIVDEEFCEGCQFGKQHRMTFGKRNNDTKNPGDLIHSDVCGPMEIDSIGGKRYFVVFKDDYSKYRTVYFLKEKSEVFDKMKLFLAEVKTLGHTVKQMQTDNGTEYCNSNVRELLGQNGIVHRTSMPYTPEQNGSAERENRTLVECARTMIHAKDLPTKLWAEAVNTAAYILNRTGPTSLVGKTPYELWHRKTTTVEHIKVFGTECFIHVPKQRRKKWDKKSVKGHLVGYCADADGFRIWVPEKQDIVFSRDVVFKKEELCSKKSKFSLLDEVTCNAKVKARDTEEVQLMEKQEAEEVEQTENQEGEEVEQMENQEAEEVEQVNNNINQAEEETTNEAMPSNYNLRNRHNIRLPTALSDYVLLATDCNPATYDDAMESEEKVQWQEAIDNEMKSLIENETWEIVDLPNGKRPIGCRWVLRTKVNTNGEIVRYKARLVAKGYSQQKGVDFDETFSPVARFDTIRSVISVAANEKLELAQFDIKTAFLNGQLDEEIYMAQPEGYNDGTHKVCKLKRSLYGLKQAPRCWNQRFVNFMASVGLIESKADPCLFVRQTATSKLIVVIYVDDGLLAGTHQAEIDEFLMKLKEEFEITTSTAECYLGIQIVKELNGSIILHQEAYAKKLLNRFGMSDSKPVQTPLVKDNETLNESNELRPNVPYREAIGSLMFLSTVTRPDLAYAVSIAARSMENPTEKDWCNVKRILRYIKGTLSYGLSYNSNEQSTDLMMYSDSDYANDVGTRKSTSGFVCKFAGGAITWKSKRQQCVALSTTEAEFIAASEAAREAMWLIKLFEDLTASSHIPVIQIDNQSAIKLIKNPVFHCRTKHIDTRYCFTREKFNEGIIDVEYVRTEDQVADIFTKILMKCRFQYLSKLLGMHMNQ